MDKPLPDLSRFWLAQSGQPAPSVNQSGDVACNADSASDEQLLAALAERVNAARAVV